MHPSVPRQLARVAIVLLACLAIASAVVTGITIYFARLTVDTFQTGVPVSAAEFDRDFNPVPVLPGFEPRALSEFPVESAAKVGDAVHPDELVIGVEVGGASRAYPVNGLTGPEREILNDTLGGRHIAATW